MSKFIVIAKSCCTPVYKITKTVILRVLVLDPRVSGIIVGASTDPSNC